MKKVNVLTLDDVLELSGPSLNLGATEATGATRVVLREGGEEIEFFTDASCDGGPAELDRRTSLTWDRGDVAVSKGRLTLKDKEEVELTFHWPNPLTPAGSGLWLRLAIVRDGAGHWVRMAQQYPATGATVWWRRLTSRPAWEEYRLPLRVPRVSVAQLLSVWKNQGFGYASGDPAAGSCPLVAGADGPACLVELDARERGRGVFLLAAEKRWASARFRAEGVRARTGQRALGLSELGFAPRPYVFQGDLDLRSAGGPREFFLEWPGIPAGGPLPSEVLSLQALWQEVAQHYALGLAATRARRHLTFVPTELQGRSDPVNLHIRVAADPRSAGGPPLWKANLFQIGPVDCRLDLVLGGARTEEGCALRVPVWARSSEWKPIVDHLHDRFVKERPTIPPLLGLGLDLDSASDRPVSSALVVSGVRFDVQGFERGRLRCTAEPGADVHGRPPLGVDLRLDFTVSTPRAATQDPEIGFETQSSWLGRERPICVDLSEETRTTFDLCVVERATGGLSRLLRLTVRAPEGLGSLTTDTFVLDPSPLQVARVLTANKLEEGTVLAEYTDDSDLPPEWAFRTETGQMDIVLPPQVIGEEMIKGKLAVGGKPVPDPNALFDFRLSAPAYLRLDRTDVDAARASAPWALRRLLSQRLGVTGVRLQEAIFELLYGLTTTLRAPGLRIAELDAFVGRVPFADELCALLGVEIEAPDATGELTVAELRRRHATDLARWIRALLHRPAQMPVFREWTDRRKLTLFEGVGFALRPSRQTAHPFDLTSFADRTPPDQHDKARRPLRGGVDFPFETRSIYEAFRRSTTPNDGTVSGLTFGSLGGTGGQQAVFDNGKTLVISETTQGRLDSLTLIRVGRVAMLWNHARHVIVYERTTRTAPRYTHGEQPDDFEGLAALRKVREYVEILQPRRDYPDFPAGLPYAGPLQRSTFETTVIPVKSTWGRDVENGWVMPLRGPLSPEEEEAFPVPKVFSELARAAGKGEGRIAHRVTNPDVLHFFTSTRDEDGGDTDAWPSFPDVDFPVTERPSQPPLPSAPRFSDLSIQPDAVGVGYGQRRFTVDLAPAEEAANLMHGRPVPGIEARVHNLSLARGKPPVLAPCDSLEALAGRPFAEAEAVLRDGIAELSGSLARLDRGGDATLGQIGQSWSEAQALHKNLANRATALRGTLEKQRSDLEKYAFSWRKEQDLWLERHGASAKRLVERELKPAVETALQTAGDLVGKGQDALKQSLTIDLEGLCRQARGHLDEVSLLPELALEPLRRASRDLRARTEATLAGARVRIDALLSDLEARYAAEGARALEAELFEGLFDVRERLVAFQSQARRLGSEALGVWFGLQRDAAGKPNAVDQIADAVNIACGNVLRELELAIGEIPPLEVGVDWASIRALFGSLEVDVAPLFDKIDAHISKLANVDIEIGGKRYGLLPKDGRSRWKELLDPGASIEKACGAAHDIIEKLKFENVASDLATAHGVLQSFVEKAGEKLATSSPELGAFLDAFGKIESWNSTLGETGDINQPLDAIESALEELGSVLASAGSPVADAAAAAGRAATLLGEHLDALGRRVEGAVLAEARALGRLLPSDGIHLELTRALAEGPVTDALRCTRRLLGYTYDAASALLQATRSSALFNDLGPGVLNSLGVRLPFDRLGDRLLPRLDGLAIGDLFPDFGGLKLAHFLKGLRVPSDPAQEFGWVRVTHGFDKDRLLGWAEVVVDKRFEEEPSLFDLPPFSLRLVRPHFSATSRFEADATGGRHQTSRASLAADWKLCLSNQPVITIKKGVLRHESDGGFGFDFKAKDLELAEPLRFVTDAVSALLPQAEGLTVSPVPPGGISAELNLPLPDLAAGAFTLTGITLHSHFDLLIGQGFEVRAGLWLSKPDRPFGLAVLFLGGGGWFGVDVSYRPPDVFETRLSVGISAGAFVSLNFGVAKGSAGVLFTAGLDFYRSDRTGARGDTSVSLGLLVWGEFSIVGIASAHLRMVLRVTYRNGEMKGHGRMSVRIKICWCFTLEVESEIDLPFDRGGAPRAMPAGTKALSAPRLGTAASVTPVATIERAVDLHLGSLDLVEAA